MNLDSQPVGVRDRDRVRAYVEIHGSLVDGVKSIMFERGRFSVRRCCLSLGIEFGE